MAGSVRLSWMDGVNPRGSRRRSQCKISLRSLNRAISRSVSWLPTDQTDSESDPDTGCLLEPDMACHFLLLVQWIQLMLLLFNWRTKAFPLFAVLISLTVWSAYWCLSQVCCLRRRNHWPCNWPTSPHLALCSLCSSMPSFRDLPPKWICIIPQLCLGC